MASEGNKDVPNEALSMEQSSTSGAKRKRGRPRKYEYPVYDVPQKAQPIQSVPPLRCTQDGLSIRQDGLQSSLTSGDRVHGNRSGRPRNSANKMKNSDNQASYHSSALQDNSGKDDVLGKHFVGKLTKKIPGFSLITVKVKDNQVLKGWVPDENNLRQITPKDDLAPELPMLRPSQVRKRASAIHMQAAPPVPIHLEDVTLAKPLQMRRPAEKIIAKHTAPLPPRPYIGSAVLAAIPVSISPSNPEMRTLAKHDTELVIPQSSVAAVPIKSARPVLVPCKQVENELAGKKSVNEFQKDSESSNETKDSSVIIDKPNTALVDIAVKDSPEERQLLNVQVTDVVKESSGQTRNVDVRMTDEIKITSGTADQPDSAKSEQQSSKEPSDITEQSEQLKTETVVLKGVDGLKSGTSDDVHPAHDEHEMKVDSN
ncbi:uncharacterized protein LOC101778327 isoform X1 [Setaria italica]|uniref:uncharacterized protein LOC101778327 isoform X1 n=1 Tax=Setaria italica TaxID=4555 RepID=UPI000648176B|nr:uncharacterized protein LOC101778327 isoform X1 [Setaria italica]